MDFGFDFQAAAAAMFQESNASSLWYRIVRAERRQVGTEKQFRIAECIETALSR